MEGCASSLSSSYRENWSAKVRTKGVKNEKSGVRPEEELS